MKPCNFSHILCYVLVVLGMLCGACSSEPDFGKFISVPTYGWTRGDTVAFVTDTLLPGVYTVDINLRGSNAHPFSYQSITIHIGAANDSSVLYRDTLVAVSIYDDNGTPRGKGLSLHDVSQAAGELWLRDTTAVTFHVNHHMQNDTLTGIASVGIIIKQH